jgi:bacillithiol system protein YtxJ
MNWLSLTSEEDLKTIKQRSHEQPCLILKHSTTCSISQIAKSRLERDWDFSEAEITPYYLDLLQNRHISREIADIFNVHHESPQVLLIVDGECIYDASHLDISVEEIKESMAVNG